MVKALEESVHANATTQILRLQRCVHAVCVRNRDSGSGARRRDITAVPTLAFCFPSSKLASEVACSRGKFHPDPQNAHANTHHRDEGPTAIRLGVVCFHFDIFFGFEDAVYATRLVSTW